jgi:hypothetical protein
MWHGENWLVEKQLKNALLLAAFLLAFIYRFTLLTWQTFPSGSDIGLHESVIKTITSEKTSFFVNIYHMGGGTSATNPGYHIFVATLTSFTGLPDILALSIVTAAFSTLTIFGVYLIVKVAWSSRAAYLAAFLAAFSAGDFAMLAWGGYPNIIALMLIPTVFFLFLQKDRFSRSALLGAASIIIASMFLTHVYSSVIFVSITAVTLFACLLFYKKVGINRRFIFAWVAPVVLGITLVSPYLINMIPAYFGSEGTVTGANLAENQAILETRGVATSILVVCTIFG